MHSIRPFDNLITGAMSRPRRVRFAIELAIALLAVAASLPMLQAQPAQAQSFNVIHSFGAGYPYSWSGFPNSLAMDNAGTLYGTTMGGGGGGWYCRNSQGCGTAFRLTNHGSQWDFTTLYQFGIVNLRDGVNPESLVLGPDGSLYGTSINGGIEGYGTAFKLSAPTQSPSDSFGDWQEVALYSFGTEKNLSRRAAHPIGTIAMDSAGNIYGTNRGWDQGDSTVAFRLTPHGTTFMQTVLSSVDPIPNGLTFDNAGNLYGTTEGGGAYGCGVVYQLQPLSGQWRYVILHSFDGSDGCDPSSNVVFDRAGNLYGSTNWQGPQGSGGTVFMLSPSGAGWTFHLIHSYSDCDCSDQNYLAVDAHGTVYGTSEYNGAYEAGSVYKLTPSDGGWVYTTLHDFSGSEDGGYPTFLMLGPDGNLYGTTYNGGMYLLGVVFQITP